MPFHLRLSMLASVVLVLLLPFLFGEILLGGLGKLHICGNTTHLLSEITRSDADIYNVDHMVDLASAANVYGEAGVCFKGNLDPVREILQATPADCERRALQCLRAAAGKRYMLSAGCEIPAAASDEVLLAFSEAPRTFAG